MIVIEGSRVDNLEYLSKHNISPMEVSFAISCNIQRNDIHIRSSPLRPAPRQRLYPSSPLIFLRQKLRNSPSRPRPVSPTSSSTTR